jgi:hypothetical protein
MAGDGHETPFNMPLTARGGTDVRTIDQREPFQCSASVLSAPAGFRVMNHPTAVHARGEEHDTPVSVLDSAPTGAGVDSSDHLDPSQRSANAAVVSKPTLLTNEPTAVHAFQAGHDTPSS